MERTTIFNSSLRGALFATKQSRLHKRPKNEIGLRGYTDAASRSCLAASKAGRGCWRADQSPLLTNPLARIAEQAHPRAVFFPFGRIPRILQRAKHALGVRHHDGEAAVGCRETGDALR
jgi:hypothetical protein